MYTTNAAIFLLLWRHISDNIPSNPAETMKSSLLVYFNITYNRHLNQRSIQRTEGLVRACFWRHGCDKNDSWVCTTLGMDEYCIPQCNVIDMTKKWKIKEDRNTLTLQICKRPLYRAFSNSLTWLVSAILVPAVQCSVWKGSCAGCLCKRHLMPSSIMKGTVVLGGRGDGAVFADVAILCCRSLCFGLHCAVVCNDSLLWNKNPKKKFNQNQPQD